MLEELKRFLVFMKPAFSRRATYCWFVVVFTGFILRSDNFGVSSIVRALSLAPESYTCLLHFFHSTAWNVEATMAIWWRWLVGKKVTYRIDNRMVLVGDHTKTPKDGRNTCNRNLRMNSSAASVTSLALLLSALSRYVNETLPSLIMPVCLWQRFCGDHKVQIL